MDLINFIWLVYPAGVNTILTAIDCGDDPEYDAASLLGCLLDDPEFSEYSENELQAAISEIIADSEFYSLRM